jgi:hypothetical protein
MLLFSLNYCYLLWFLQPTDGVVGISHQNAKANRVRLSLLAATLPNF